jgi:hypothetical protein
MKDMAVTKLEFSECSYSAIECAAVMANGLARNTSVSCIKVERLRDEAFYSILVTAFASNSTLRQLELDRRNSNVGPDLSPIFLALRENTGIKNLIVGGFGSMDESLCTAIKDGLELNETLESLEINGAALIDANLWCRAFPFSASLKGDVGRNSSTESCGSAFCRHILQGNVSLESLSIRN